MWSKEFGIDFKRKINKISKDYISHQKEMKGIILNDCMQNIFFALMNFIFFGKKVLWIIIIITIEACVAIDTSKKIKWFIMNVICNIS